MPIGDDATAAGYDLVGGTEDRRNGYLEINKTRDYLAQLKTFFVSQFTSFYTKTEVEARLLSKADNFGDVLGVRKAEGPTSSAYSRSATGSSWYTVWMNSALQFMRNTSSRRYKTAERPLDIDPRRILEMVPTTYHRKGQPRGTRELGLIAEDLAELGLPHIVQWEEHEPGHWRPEAVRYEQVLPVMLLHVCRDLQAQIDLLRQQVSPTTEETP